MKIPAAVYELARQQHGAVSRWQLRDSGVSDRVERNRVRLGQWLPLLGAVLIDNRSSDNDLRTAWALHLSSRVPIAVSGSIAVRLQGWDLPSSAVIGRTEQHLTLPGVTFRRIAGPVIARDGLLLVPREPALLDTLTQLPLEEANGVLDLALQRRWMSDGRFVEQAAARLRRVRVDAPRLRALIARATTGSRSEAEQRMWPILKRTGITGWVANHPAKDEAGRVLAELDFALEPAMLAIEIDGRAHHSDRVTFEKDRARQNMLVLRGWTVLRFTWEQITQHPDEVLRIIVGALQRAA